MSKQQERDKERQKITKELFLFIFFQKLLQHDAPLSSAFKINLYLTHTHTISHSLTFTRITGARSRLSPSSVRNGHWVYGGKSSGKIILCMHQSTSEDMKPLCLSVFCLISQADEWYLDKVMLMSWFFADRVLVTTTVFKHCGWLPALYNTKNAKNSLALTFTIHFTLYTLRHKFYFSYLQPYNPSCTCSIKPGIFWKE